jgi:hypothetical protein
MIFDFIDIAKIGKGEFQLINNEFLIEDIVDDMQNIFKNQIKIKKIYLKFHNLTKSFRLIYND